MLKETIYSLDYMIKENLVESYDDPIEANRIKDGDFSLKVIEDDGIILLDPEVYDFVKVDDNDPYNNIWWDGTELINEFFDLFYRNDTFYATTDFCKGDRVPYGDSYATMPDYFEVRDVFVPEIDELQDLFENFYMDTFCEAENISKNILTPADEQLLEWYAWHDYEGTPATLESTITEMTENRALEEAPEERWMED